MALYYLSLADKDRFLGGFVTEADDVESAVDVAYPTFEEVMTDNASIMVCPVDKDPPPEKYHGRLLTKAEIREFWPDAKEIGEPEYLN